MIVYPAIDIRHGLVVRLVQGDPNRQTIHSHNPVTTAHQWKDAGASWLHVINLDGTLGEATLNLDILARLARVGLPIQFGGGIRKPEHIEQALESGASRVILGTLGVKQPDAVETAITKFGSDKIVLALDARDGQVATHGWQEKSHWTPVELGSHFARLGLIHALYTDIRRDGNLKGVNVSATAELARQTGLRVIASGGVSSLEDIAALKNQSPPISGVVIGKALYSNLFTLEQALSIIN